MAPPNLSDSVFADEIYLVDQTNRSLSEKIYANQPMVDTGTLNNGSSDPDNHEEALNIGNIIVIIKNNSAQLKSFDLALVIGISDFRFVIYCTTFLLLLLMIK